MTGWDDAMMVPSKQAMKQVDRITQKISRKRVVDMSVRNLMGVAGSAGRSADVSLSARPPAGSGSEVRIVALLSWPNFLGSISKPDLDAQEETFVPSLTDEPRTMDESLFSKGVRSSAEDESSCRCGSASGPPVEFWAITATGM